MLNGKLRLRDVDDVEALAKSILFKKLRDFNITLSREDEEDALSFLVSRAWEIEQTRYKPELGSLSTYLHITLSFGLIDWLRARFGDKRYGERPELLAFEDAGFDFSQIEDAEDFVEETIDRLTVESLVHSEWLDLSEKAKWTLENLAVAIAAGSTHQELADQHDKHSRWVGDSMRQLRKELEGLSLRA